MLPAAGCFGALNARYAIIQPGVSMARLERALDCKSVQPGSTPGRASIGTTPGKARIRVGTDGEEVAHQALRPIRSTALRSAFIDR